MKAPPHKRANTPVCPCPVATQPQWGKVPAGWKGAVAVIASSRRYGEWRTGKERTSRNDRNVRNGRFKFKHVVFRRKEGELGKKEPHATIATTATGVSSLNTSFFEGKMALALPEIDLKSKEGVALRDPNIRFRNQKNDINGAPTQTRYQ